MVQIWYWTFIDQTNCYHLKFEQYQASAVFRCRCTLLNWKLNFEASSLDRINMTKNWFEYDRKKFTSTNFNIETWEYSYVKVRRCHNIYYIYASPVNRVVRDKILRLLIELQENCYQMFICQELSYTLRFVVVVIFIIFLVKFEG